MNPATKQYLIFSFIVGILLSIIINFVLIDIIKGTFLYGFPISLNGVDGFLNFLFRVINTLLIGTFLVIPMFYIIKELNRRR